MRLPSSLLAPCARSYIPIWECVKLDVPRQARLTEIHPVAAQRDSFSKQQAALTASLREASVGADHAVPREVLVSLGQHPADEARRARVDVAVRTDEPFRDLSHAGEDPRRACAAHVRSSFRRRSRKRRSGSEWTTSSARS